jgi:16S rRNA (guanine527-N7)-methyltransferase
MSLVVLSEQATRLGVQLDAGQLARFERYRELLLEWNLRFNLTAVREPDAVEQRHFVDSLTCLLGMQDLLVLHPTARLLDVGSGGGFPGLPLKIACPDLRLTLLDSVRKKTHFLEQVIAELGVENVDVVTARAEDQARTELFREAYDLVVTRALAPLPVLLELCLPFLKVGGRLVAPRRGDLSTDQDAASGVVQVLGGRFRPPIRVKVGEYLDGYGLTIVDKVAPTPAIYPRRAGVPAKRPLT